jgi:hypothetical protein
MLKILNEHYYVDLDRLEQYVNIPQTTGDSENHISVVKYDMIKVMMEVLLTEDDLVDEALGEKSNELTIPFKLAFNTLLNKKIINKY